MKTKSFLLPILFLFLSLSVFISCSPNSTDDELYENETFGVDKDIDRPGSQGSGG